MENEASLPDRIWNRVFIFVAAVLTLIAGLAWNDALRAQFVPDSTEFDEKTKSRLFTYAISVTGILILAIVIAAWVFNKVPGI
jgi:hypothetical protein